MRSGPKFYEKLALIFEPIACDPLESIIVTGDRVHRTVGQGEIRVRPRQELTRHAVLVFLVTLIPLAGVLYWYSQGTGLWLYLAGGELSLLLFALGSWWRQSRVFASVTSATLSGNGIFSPTVAVPLDNIARVALVRVYRSQPNETSTQLVALDHTGTCLFRLRGQFWHMEDITRVAEAIGRPIDRPSTPLLEAEFFTAYPGSVYWFERHPALRPAFVIAAVCLVVLLALAVMVGAGIPILG